MSEKLINPPAYACAAENRHQEGMSLRDWFAGQALIMLPNHGCGADLDTYDTAVAAYQIADAMLKVRGE